MENVFEQIGISEQKRSKGRKKRRFGRQKHSKAACPYLAGTLASANINEEYLIKRVETNNDEMKDFLFTLGCYEGEAITVISIICDQYIVVVKDARYSIDKNLATAIII